MWTKGVQGFDPSAYGTWMTMSSWKDDSATDSCFFGMGISRIRVPLAVQKVLDGLSFWEFCTCTTHQIHAMDASVFLLLKRPAKKKNKENKNKKIKKILWDEQYQQWDETIRTIRGTNRTTEGNNQNKKGKTACINWMPNFSFCSWYAYIPTTRSLTGLTPLPSTIDALEKRGDANGSMVTLVCRWELAHNHYGYPHSYRARRVITYFKFD